MHRPIALCALASMCAVAFGCGDDDPPPPANVAGDYTISVTNDENACMLADWTVGETTTNIPLTITQSGTAINGSITGLAGAWFDVVVGVHDFDEGSVVGNNITLTMHGTRAYNSGGCTATLQVDAAGTLMGDVLQGELRYSFNTNGSAECGVLNTCFNTARFNGTRPPSL